MKRREYGVLTRDLGNVDLEDEEERKLEKKEEAGGRRQAEGEEKKKEPADKLEKPERSEGREVEAEEDKEVMAEEVREVEAEEIEESIPAKRRRGKLMLAVAAVLVVVLIPLLYFVVIPRTELTLKVYYNESVLNQINVDSELRNGGTVAVDDLTLEISVVNSSDQEMGGQNYTVRSIAPFSGPEKLEAITFRGSQYDEYTIIIDLQFSSGGRGYSGHWSHGTEEPWMNQDFTETVSGF